MKKVIKMGLAFLMLIPFPLKPKFKKYTDKNIVYYMDETKNVLC